MAFPTSNVLDVLEAHDIRPVEDNPDDTDFPGVGELEDGETVYSTSIAEVGREDEPASETGVLDAEDPRLREWLDEIERIKRAIGEPRRSPRGEPPEPTCAWYCPIHFFGHGWGIYIRERCILSVAIDIATFVHWPSVRAPTWAAARHLLRSAFYAFFLHEQFHHKVESLGFRLLISTGTDRYRPYHRNVYRRTYLTSDCLEESLANSESYRRLGETRYVQRMDPAILDGLRNYLKASIPLQPPGYREGVKYISEPSYRDGLYRLQSQVLDGVIPSTTRASHWSIAPNMITALADITEDIYVVLPSGARPIFRPTSVNPGATVSARALVQALTKHYGYQPVPGGKGSHIKLKRPGAPTIVVPGNRAVLSPGVVKHALDAIGGYPISRLPDFLDGKLTA